MADRANSTALTCAPCLRGDHQHCTIPDRCTCVSCYPPEKEPILIWEEPVHKFRGWVPPDDVWEELRAHPKRWGMLKEFDTKQAAANKANTFKKAYGEKGFEFAARRAPNDHSKFFARYIGEEDE